MNAPLPENSHVDDVGFTIVRWFDAPPDRVFAAMTDTTDAPRWMWAGMGKNPRAEIDLRVGGRFRIAIDPEDGEAGWNDGDLAMSGVYLEVEPGRRLTYTLHWEADVGYNRGDTEVLDEAVIIDLTPSRAGSQLVFRHIGIPDDGESAAEHCRGTAVALDMLRRLVED
jgi:uncharacterized protein YndB with AHSA1/START domain